MNFRNPHKVFFLTLFIFICAKVSCQEQHDLNNQILFYKEHNPWSLGLGINTLLLDADLKSFNTKTEKIYLNLGGYIYLNKKLNLNSGIEAKFNFSKFGGAVSDVGDTVIKDISPKIPIDSIYVQGNLYGLEFNYYRDFFERSLKKSEISGYLGIGLQKYNSKIMHTQNDEVLLDQGEESGGFSKSLYFNLGLGYKYKMSKKINLEARTTYAINKEDHLDAAVSDKNKIEGFFNASLGLSFVIGPVKRKQVQLYDDGIYDHIEFIDKDNDGVADFFDKELKTPKGTLVYGNGIAIEPELDSVLQTKRSPLSSSRDSDSNNSRLWDVKKDNDLKDLEVKLPRFAPFYSETIYFDSDSFELDQHSKDALNKVAQLILKFPEQQYLIKSYTDSTGNKNYNLNLSVDRAIATYNYLISKGVESHCLQLYSFGEEFPIQSNTKITGRQFNRRVEIVFKNEILLENETLETKTTQIKKDPVLTWKYHKVKKGETLFSIAQKHHVSVALLKTLNDLKSSELHQDTLLLVSKKTPPIILTKK